jgi:hypothetical protein
MHHSWHSEGKTDLSVLRSNAERRRVDSYHPEETTIHIHPHGLSCGRYEHEEYLFPEQKDTTEEQGTTTIPANTLQVGDEIKLGTWNDENHDA